MPGPLSGYTVIDLTQVVSGPLATMLMADQGADVIKVEPVNGADPMRLPAFAKGGLAAIFLNNNRGKRCLDVDLSADEGRQIVLDLVAGADVFVQNFRPGVIERLGLGYDDLRAVNPDIVYCSISGFGSDGPYADRPVIDPVIQAYSGVVSRQLNPEIPFPDLIRNLYADKATALTVSQAVTAALLVREKGGGGQRIDIPMIDACLYFFWPDGMMDKTVLDPDATPGFLLSSVYNLTDCADGKIIYFVISDPQRQALFRAVGRPEWAEDERFTMVGTTNPENFQLMGQMLAERFEAMTVDEALSGLVANEVPCAPILEADEVIADPQITHNGTLVEWEHPEAGRLRQPRPAARFSATPAQLAASASLKGADNDEILASIGRGPEVIAQLRQAGVIS